MTTPIDRPPWETYYFVKDDDGEYSSHTTIRRGMVVVFIIYLHAKDGNDKCTHVRHPRRKAPLADMKVWFDTHKACLECDREIRGLNQ
jgi:hypothetical protein